MAAGHPLSVQFSRSVESDSFRPHESQQGSEISCWTLRWQRQSMLFLWTLGFISPPAPHFLQKPTVAVLFDGVCMCARPCLLSYLVMSDSLQPHGLQPTRLLCPGDYRGKISAKLSFTEARSLQRGWAGHLRVPPQCQACLHSSQKPSDGPCKCCMLLPTAREPNRGSADSPQSAREVGSSTAARSLQWGSGGVPPKVPSSARPSVAVISLQTALQAPRKPAQ